MYGASVKLRITNQRWETLENLHGWPERQIPIPHTLVRVPNARLYELADGAWGVVLEGVVAWVGNLAGDNFRGEWLEPEVYLHELMDLDVESKASVLAFVQGLGALQVEDIGTPWSAGPFWWGRSLWKPVRDTEEVSRRHADALGVKAELVVSAEEFRAVVGALRDAARTLWALQGVIDENALLELWEGPRGVFLDSGILLTATLRTLDTINAGLRVFSPRIYRGDVAASDAVQAVLYNVLCLEMFNDYVVGSEYRLCAKCGRVFVRQRGRARFGENKRKGKVIYCTYRCQNAAQQQKHRDRAKRLKGTEAGGGHDE